MADQIQRDNKAPSPDIDQSKTPAKNKEDKNENILKSKDFVMTKNDKEWADSHWSFIFNKYVKGKDEKEQINIDAMVYNIFKDLRVLFRVEDNIEYRNKVQKEFANNPIHPLKIFKEKLYEWIAEFREQSISDYLGEGINTISNGFKEHSKELEKYIDNQNELDKNLLNIKNLGQILPNVLNIIHARLLCLDHIVPKDDSALIKESEEQEYIEVIIKLAEEHFISVLDSDNLKNLILSYLKAGSSKYSFAHLPNFSESLGLDPYADFGEVGPGDEVKLSKTINDIRNNIDKRIEEAADDGYTEKVKILKKMKQLFEIRKHAQRAAEEESIDLMIADFQKQLDELESPEIEAEGEDNVEGEGDSILKLQIPTGNTRSSLLRDNLEERRNKGLKEIFDYYAKTQMLIGK